MSIYSAFVKKRFIHQVELEKPKMLKKNGNQDLQNFCNKNDSKVI